MTEQTMDASLPSPANSDVDGTDPDQATSEESELESYKEDNQGKILQQIAQELHVKLSQITAAVELLDDGATVPFIARYRKEVTQGLTDDHLRQLEDRLEYLRDLVSQKQTALKTITELGKLTPELKASIQDATTKQVLADIYQPYRPKRRSKASQAIDAGLQPLADQLWQNPDLDPEETAKDFLNPEAKFETTKAVLSGARQILAEQWAEIPSLVQQLRDLFRVEAHIISKSKNRAPASKSPEEAAPTAEQTKALEETKKEAASAAKKAHKKKEQFEKKQAKFSDYADRSEALKTLASHRTLAMFRGRREGILDLEINLINLEKGQQHPCVGRIMNHLNYTPADRKADTWLTQSIEWCWRVKLHPKIENDLLSEIKEKADLESIQVFARNLKHLLMSAPAGEITTIGLDPGIRTGVKVAVISGTGQVLDHTTIYPHAPKNQWDEATATIKTLAEKHEATLVAIGNGTASRETDKLVAHCIKTHPELGLRKAVVSEAGASIYSASEFASKELPGLDVAIRGAVSIARRLQDPLAELVKIEPKSIGVGQYQHDVSQPKLAKSLESVVEDCVNHVGVDVNTASAPLLARIAGLNDTIANNIVSFRDENGPFKNRNTLKKVPRLGQRTFEQAAGFLRIRGGENPLDGSGVHPETYELVQTIAQQSGLDLNTLIGNSQALKSVNASDFTNEKFGTLTVEDVLSELEKPGRDPRPEFKTMSFKEGVNDIKDLERDMILDGVVTNVTNFGAFVDVGVHQDGLVHISVLKDGFVSDPHTVVKTGDIVKVKVLNADVERNRIDLSMRLTESAKQNNRPPARNSKDKPAQPHKNNGTRPSKKPSKPQVSTEKALPPGKTGTFADLFAGLKR